VQVDVLEGWVRTIELPDHSPGHARNLVDSTHVSSRDQIVAVGILVDRVDVEEVPRCISCQPVSASIGAVNASVREAWSDMIQSAPLEKQFSGLNIDFLEQTIMDPTKARTDTKGAQVVLPRLVDSDQGSLSAVYQTELVHVHLGRSTDSLHGPYDTIILVHDDTVSARPSVVLESLEEADMVRTLILADMGVVCRRTTQRASTGPNELSIVIVNVRSRIGVSVRRKEDITRDKKIRPEDVEADDGSVKIRSLYDIRGVV
jgi:hypothetical protein